MQYEYFNNWDYWKWWNTDVNVWGLCRWHSTTTLSNIEGIKDQINLRECDLLDISSIIRVLKESNPERIFHLAAYANVRKCFDTPLSVINNNIMKIIINDNFKSSKSFLINLQIYQLRNLMPFLDRKIPS